MPDDTNKLRTGWDEFASWHGDPKLYREIYTRAIGALIAALIIYLVAALFGAVSAAPGIWLGSISVVVAGAAAGWATWRRSKRASTPSRRGKVEVLTVQMLISVAAAILTLGSSLVAEFINR